LDLDLILYIQSPSAKIDSQFAIILNAIILESITW